MKNNILNFLVYTNLYVALAVLSLTIITCLIFSIPITNSCFFSFFGTLFIYNFSHLVEITSNLRPLEKRHLFVSKFKRQIKSITIISFLFVLYFVFAFSKITFFYVLPVAIISVLYFTPVFGFKLRDIPGAKLFLIAIVWTVVTVFIPVMDSQILINNAFWSVCLQRFLFVLAITVPFDIRDLSFDSPSIKTLPMVVGVQKSKLISILILGVAEVLLFVQYFTSDIYTVSQFLALFLCYEIAAVLVYFCEVNKNDEYYSLVIEGTSILMLLFYLFSSIF